MTLITGQSLSFYEILGPLGAGGMGEVYLARDSRLDREVAIKVLSEEMASDKERLRRFEREAKMLASLNHTNIAGIHGIDQVDDTCFLAMELVPGEDLEDRLQRGALPLDEAIEVCRQIAEGLEVAHEAGVVHRDLKPANVRITPEGAVKLLDFGLAKPIRPEISKSGSKTAQSDSFLVTSEGMILGTPTYMSPEQARGKPVDRRTDIWAFGCVLYECLAGKRAFKGDAFGDLIVAILEHEIDLAALPNATPPRVRELIVRCLVKDPRKRLRDVGEARLELERCLQLGDAEHGESETQKPAEAPPLRRRAAAWALIAIGVALGGLAVWNLKPKSTTPIPPVSRLAVVLPADEKFLGSAELPLAVSPDGTLLAYCAQRGGEPVCLFIRPMNSLEHTLVPGTDGADSPFFSPDGQWLGFFAGRKLKKVPITGGAVQTICKTADRGLGASWGNDDRIIFTSIGSSGLFRVSADGGVAETLPTAEGGLHSRPDILPGGQVVLFGTQSGSQSDRKILALRLDTGERKLLVQGGSSPRYLATGHLVYNDSGTVMVAPFDAAQLEFSGAPVRLLEHPYRQESIGRDRHLVISQSGTLAYLAASSSDSRSRMVWVDRLGAVEPLTAPARTYFYPRVSPDGRRIATGISEDLIQVWVYDTQREMLTRQTFDQSTANAPIWSPDGKRIAFISNREGPLNIYWQLADGGGGMDRLTTTEYQSGPSSFSPDGELLAFIEDHPQDGRAIRVLNLANKEVETFLQTGFEETAPRFSPDGKWIVHTSTESGRREVYVRPYPGPGGKWQISNYGGQEPVWNPQGGELFYRSGSKLMSVVIDTDSGFAHGTPEMLFEGPYLPTDASFAFYDVSPDGERFLMLDPVAPQSGATQIHVILNWFEELRRKVPSD